MFSGGDIFDSPHPTPEVYAFFLHILRRLRAAGIVVYILRGNHDGSVLTRGGHALLPVNVVEDKDVHVFVAASRTFPPGFSGLFIPHGYDPNAIPLGADDLWGICHCDLEGAVVGSEARMLRGGASLLSPALRDNPRVIHWIANHVHKPQEVGDRITIVGSIIQVDRGEAGEEKRILTLDTESKKLTSHSLREFGACEFVTECLDFAVNEEVAQKKYIWLRSKPFTRNTLLTVEVRLRPGQTFDSQMLERELRESPYVRHVRRIVPEIVTPEIRRNPEVVIEKAPLESVEAFIRATVPPQNVERILSKANDCLRRAL